MKHKLKILLLDNNNERLRGSTSLMHCCGDCCIDPRLTINQHDYESNDYDVIFAHYSNKEVREYIVHDDWDSKNSVIVFFGGDFSTNKEKDPYESGVWWVSASYLEKKENICVLLQEVFEK